MNKQERITKIIQDLLNHGKLSNFTREDINKAILRALWLNDERSYGRWFDLLWGLGFLVQPQPEAYSLNLERVGELEVEIPLGKEQRRLIE